VRNLTLRTGRVKCNAEDSGFRLIEMVCAVAILALLASLALPNVPRSTSRARLEAYAVETATLLKSDRYVAMRKGRQVTTRIDAKSRAIRSGSTGRILRIPEDVNLDATLAASCNQRGAGSTIEFFPSGMSCGGVVVLSKSGVGFEIRVNWLIGSVEVVPLNDI